MSREIFSKAAHRTWLFEGKPELVDVNISSSSAVEGGYVIALKLATGEFRLAATRQPAKYVSSWRHNVRRYGVPDIVRVFISKPHLRYEAVKRGLANLLKDYKSLDSDAFTVGDDVLSIKAAEIFFPVDNSSEPSSA